MGDCGQVLAFEESRSEKKLAKDPGKGVVFIALEVIVFVSSDACNRSC